MYRALYRKWRPYTFEDVVGQEAITSALCNQITAGKVAHAYLFTGTRGTGKTTCAKIFAKAINCEAPNGANPCGQCEPCVGIDNGSILDVTEIDAASNNSVEDVRALREETAYRPSRCKYRVYIIDEVHMLSTSAFNALLKIMEEPPSHVVFILATTEIHKVPATIVSRCQRFDFGRIPAELIAQRLLFVAKEEGFALTAEAADLIARLADGALRDALSLLDTCSGSGEEVNEALVRRMAGVADKEYLFLLSAAVQANDIAGLVEQIAKLRAQSIDVRRLTEELVHHYRTLLLAAVQPSGALLQDLPQPEQQRYLSEAKTIGESASLDAVRRLTAAVDKMSRAPDPKIELEIALFDLCRPPVEAMAPVPHPVVQAPAKPPVVAPEKEAQISKAAPVPPQSVEAAEKPEPPKAPSPTPPPTPPKEVVAQAPAGLQPFDGWAQVVEGMKGMDRMLHSFMISSKAYLDGKRVLIDGGEMFLTYMRDYPEATEKVKTSIEQVTGVRYPVGPYKKDDIGKPTSTIEQTLDDLKALGVDVEVE